MSSDLRREIADAVVGIIAARTGDAFDLALWQDLERAGFTLLGVPEEAGGSGGTFGDAAVVVDVAARHAAAVPLAETALAAGLLAGAGIGVPTGPLTLADGGRLTMTPGAGGGTTVDGVLPSVPWGRCCDHVVVHPSDDGGSLLLLTLPGGTSQAEGVTVVHGANTADEPRDDIVLADVAVVPGRTAVVDGDAVRALRLRAAVLRAVMIGGASASVLDAALRHVREREQFGRPLARFQVVQHYVAALAAEVAAVRGGVEAALNALDAADPAAADGAAGVADAEVEVAVAAAKAYASAAAGGIAAVGHQLLGAIGYTTEHRLGAWTTRLWAWREECGNEDVWSEWLGRQVLVHDSGGLWPLLTGVPDAPPRADAIRASDGTGS